MNTFTFIVSILVVTCFNHPILVHDSTDASPDDDELSDFDIKDENILEALKKSQNEKEIEALENSLTKKWEDLELLLLCAKLPLCVTRYYKETDALGKKERMSFKDSFQIIIKGIQKLSQKLASLKAN